MFKRILDILVSLIVLVVFLPFGILLAMGIVIDSSGGVFFRQERIGLNGKPFALLKFRSMYTNAHSKGTLTIGMRDPRITRIGVFIRKFKLDEFPQFINVLSGSMSIVGPRPEVEEFVKLYNEEQKKVLTVKPGITDYASIAYFKENEILAKSEDPKQAYIDEIMPDKLRINLEYIRKQSVWEDFKIIIKTFGKIIKN